MSQAFAQQRAAEKLARRGLQTNPETGEIEPIQKADASGENQSDAGADNGDAGNNPVDQGGSTGALDYKAEYERMKADMEALKGRLAPAQRDADTFRGLYETSSRELNSAREQTASELADLKRQLDEATSAKQRKSIEAEIEELISEEDRAVIDPSVLAVIRKVAGKFASSATPAATVDHNQLVEKALAERDKKNVDAHRNRMLADTNTEIGKLKALSQDAEFNAYCEDNPEVDMTLTHFLHASTTADIDRYARAANRLISAYRTGKAPKDVRAADPKSAGGSVLQSALARTAAGKMSEEQVRSKMREFKQLIRNNDPDSKAKAKAIMAEIEANT
jgi:hypothetical protein